MDKAVSIVKVSNRNYKRIAQDNWGLTKEQMKGMHVHHRIPVSAGGTNDPCNLYVCSPWFHKNIWHSEDGFNSLIPHAASGGKLGGKISPAGKISYNEKSGLFGLTPDKKKEAEIKGGKLAHQMQTACHNPKYKGLGAKKTNAMYWVDPNHPELGILQAGPLACKQKSLGLPHGPENRVKVRG
jgi:hypothetical protein